MQLGVDQRIDQSGHCRRLMESKSKETPFFAKRATSCYKLCNKDVTSSQIINLIDDLLIR
jgi:hypothetical protein